MNVSKFCAHCDRLTDHQTHRHTEVIATVKPDHPYVVLCDEARCAPDTFTDRPADLAARWTARTGRPIAATRVQEMADDFRRHQSLARSHDVPVMGS